MKESDSKIDLEKEIDKELSSRPRSATLLNLQWLAEKFRKTVKLKSLLSDGAYSVNSEELAKSLLNKKTKD